MARCPYCDHSDEISVEWFADPTSNEHRVITCPSCDAILGGNI